MFSLSFDQQNHPRVVCLAWTNQPGIDCRDRILASWGEPYPSAIANKIALKRTKTRHNNFW